MTSTATRLIRASFADAASALERQRGRHDPPAGDSRPVKEGGWGYLAGQWPGAPASRMPPDCPVVALGRDGKNYYFMDSMLQLNVVERGEFSKKTLLDLFSLAPNYLQHHWPRWGAPKGGNPSKINGLEVDDCIQCLMFACAQAGAIRISDKVRGRGAWQTERGHQLVWHAGDALYTIENRQLQAARPGAIDGMVYAGAAPVMTPWREPVPMAESPAQKLLAMLRSWSWERPFDPLLIIGWLGCAFLGGALPWRPYIFITGDKGVGKSTLMGLLHALLGDTLHKTANTTAAGIYQRIGKDSLPVAVDELEATEDNRRATSIYDLARIAASADDMFRGGADHEGISFRLQNTFLFSGILPPPQGAADKSRCVMVNLARLDPRVTAGGIKVFNGDEAETMGRMMLRCLMDCWPRYQDTLEAWRAPLRAAGLDDRAQMTYGTLFAMANLLLGDEAMEDAGLPVTEDRRLGELVAQATAGERAEQRPMWEQCIERLMGHVIDSWRGGEKPTVGETLEEWEAGRLGDDVVMSRLKLVGLGIKLLKTDAAGAELPRAIRTLAVPIGVELGPAKIFADTKFRDGVWSTALKHAPAEVVIRDRGNGQNVKINRVTARCLLVDLAAYDRATDR